MRFFRKHADIALETEQLFQHVGQDVRAVYGPPGELTTSIVSAAHRAWLELAPVFRYQASGTPSEPQMYLLFELLYFFAHMTLRLAVASRYSERQIAALQSFMGPLLASTAVDSFFAQWPEERKTGLRSDFFEKLNEAEQEYATCRQFVADDDPFSADALFGRVARNACALWERDQDVEALTATVTAVTGSFSDLALAAQVAHVKTVIDRVNPETLASFWASQGA